MFNVQLISLERAVDRREALKIRGLPHEWVDSFFPGTAGTQLTQDALESQFDLASMSQRYGRSPLAGELGCAISHRRAYSAFLQTNCQWCLMLEDDVIPPQGGPNSHMARIQQLLGPLKNARGPTFIHLGIRAYQFYISQPQLIIALSVLFRRHRIFRLGEQSHLWLAHAYLVNRAMAERLIQRTPISLLADDWSGLLQGDGTDVFCCWPPLFAQDPDIKSQIGGTFTSNAAPTSTSSLKFVSSRIGNKLWRASVVLRSMINGVRIKHE